jgi:hypothetical protein
MAENLDDLPASLEELRDELTFRKVMLESIREQLREGRDDPSLGEEEDLAEQSIRVIQSRIREIQQERKGMLLFCLRSIILLVDSLLTTCFVNADRAGQRGMTSDAAAQSATMDPFDQFRTGYQTPMIGRVDFSGT